MDRSPAREAEGIAWGRDSEERQRLRRERNHSYLRDLRLQMEQQNADPSNASTAYVSPKTYSGGDQVALPRIPDALARPGRSGPLLASPSKALSPARSGSAQDAVALAGTDGLVATAHDIYHRLAFLEDRVDAERRARARLEEEVSRLDGALQSERQRTAELDRDYRLFVRTRSAAENAWGTPQRDLGEQLARFQAAITAQEADVAALRESIRSKASKEDVEKSLDRTLVLNRSLDDAEHTLERLQGEERRRQAVLSDHVAELQRLFDSQSNRVIQLEEEITRRVASLEERASIRDVQVRDMTQRSSASDSHAMQVAHSVEVRLGQLQTAVQVLEEQVREQRAAANRSADLLNQVHREQSQREQSVSKKLDQSLEDLNSSLHTEKVAREKENNEISSKIVAESRSTKDLVLASQKELDERLRRDLADKIRDILSSKRELRDEIVRALNKMRGLCEHLNAQRERDLQAIDTVLKTEIKARMASAEQLKQHIRASCQQTLDDSKSLCRALKDEMKQRFVEVRRAFVDAENVLVKFQTRLNDEEQMREEGLRGVEVRLTEQFGDAITAVDRRLDDELSSRDERIHVALHGTAEKIDGVESSIKDMIAKGLADLEEKGGKRLGEEIHEREVALADISDRIASAHELARKAWHASSERATLTQLQSVEQKFQEKISHAALNDEVRSEIAALHATFATDESVRVVTGQVREMKERVSECARATELEALRVSCRDEISLGLAELERKGSTRLGEEIWEREEAVRVIRKDVQLEMEQVAQNASFERKSLAKSLEEMLEARAASLLEAIQAKTSLGEVTQLVSTMQRDMLIELDMESVRGSLDSLTRSSATRAWVGDELRVIRESVAACTSSEVFATEVNKLQMNIRTKVDKEVLSTLVSTDSYEQMVSSLQRRQQQLEDQQEEHRSGISSLQVAVSSKAGATDVVALREHLESFVRESCSDLERKGGVRLGEEIWEREQALQSVQEQLTARMDRVAERFEAAARQEVSALGERTTERIEKVSRAAAEGEKRLYARCDDIEANIRAVERQSQQAVDACAQLGSRVSSMQTSVASAAERTSTLSTSLEKYGKLEEQVDSLAREVVSIQDSAATRASREKREFIELGERLTSLEHHTAQYKDLNDRVGSLWDRTGALLPLPAAVDELRMLHREGARALAELGRRTTASENRIDDASSEAKSERERLHLVIERIESQGQERLASSMESVQRDVLEVKERLRAETGRVDVLSSAVDGCATKAALADLLERGTAALAPVAGRVGDLESMTRSMEIEHARAAHSLSLAVERVDGVEERCRGAEARGNELEGRARAVEAQLAGVAATATRSAERLTQLEERVSKTEDKDSLFAQRLGAVQDRGDVLEEKAAEHRGELERVAAELAAQSRQSKENTMACTRIDVEVTSLRDSSNTLTNAVRDHEQTFVARDEFKSLVRSLEDLRTECSSDARDIRAKLLDKNGIDERVQEAVRSALVPIREVHRELGDAAKKDRHGVEEVRNALSSSLAQCQERLQEVERRLALLSSDGARTAAALPEGADEPAPLHDEVVLLSDKLQALEKRIDTMSGEVEKLRDSGSGGESDDAVARVAKSAASAKAQVDELGAAVREVTRALDALCGSAVGSPAASTPDIPAIPFSESWVTNASLLRSKVEESALRVQELAERLSRAPSESIAAESRVKQGFEDERIARDGLSISLEKTGSELRNRIAVLERDRDAGSTVP